MAVVNAYLPRPSQLMIETEEGQKVAAACVEFGGWHHREKNTDANPTVGPANHAGQSRLVLRNGQPRCSGRSGSTRRRQVHRATVCGQ